MRPPNREDAVQAALTIEQWCRGPEGDCFDKYDCPFYAKDLPSRCALVNGFMPKLWHLEAFLRNRGLQKEVMPDEI